MQARPPRAFPLLQASMDNVILDQVHFVSNCINIHKHYGQTSFSCERHGSEVNDVPLINFNYTQLVHHIGKV